MTLTRQGVSALETVSLSCWLCLLRFTRPGFRLSTRLRRKLCGNAHKGRWCVQIWTHQYLNPYPRRKPGSQPMSDFPASVAIKQGEARQVLRKLRNTLPIKPHAARRFNGRNFALSGQDRLSRRRLFNRTTFRLIDHGSLNTWRLSNIASGEVKV